MRAISALDSPSKWRKTIAMRCGGGRAATASVTASTVRSRSVCRAGSAPVSETSPSRSRDSVARVRVIRFSVLRVTIWYNQVEKLERALNRGDVLSVVMVAEQPQRDTVGHRAVTVHELGVGVDVAFLGTPDEVTVIDVCCHRHTCS